MNLLFCQSNRTINEISSLAGPAQFFISYKNARPKLGEAQDSLTCIAKMTESHVRFDKMHAMRIFQQTQIYPDMNQYNNGHHYTGRNLVTIMLKETGNKINLRATAKIFDQAHAPFRAYDPEETRVEINRGELVSGVLDKNTVGEGARGGLFHIIHNKYGPDAALLASWNIQQMALMYQFNAGNTINVGDFLIRDEQLAEIRKIESRIIAESHTITHQLNQGKIIPPIGKTIAQHYEEKQLNALNPGDAFWEHILRGIDTDNNNFYKMVTVGSRGKLANFKNVTSDIGQVEINGERMKESFGGRVLPYFMRHDIDPRSRGYIANSYMSGLDTAEFIMHAMEARYQLINKALSTSITGEQNRRAIKNLEARIVDNQRKLKKNNKIIQLTYGADGVDPKFIEQVKFPTAARDLSDKDLETRYRLQAKTFGKKFSNTNVQKLLDEEFEDLQAGRAFYRKLFMDLETTSGKPYSDKANMPVNIKRIMDDAVYNFHLKPGENKLDPVESITKINKLIKNIDYVLINEIQMKRQAPIPNHLIDSTRLLKVYIRSHLNMATLIEYGVTNSALGLIIKRIKMTYSKALVAYGKAMGILSAQSISEPMTQMVLDSHHHSGMASTRKKGMSRIKEILGAKPTEKMDSPSMTLQVIDAIRENKSKVQEIANHIEMMQLRRFVKSRQLFFEKYGEPEHPKFQHEAEMIKEFEKYNIHIKPPSDLTRWCIRFSIDKSELILKQMKIENIYNKLRETFPFTHIVYTHDNADNVVIRVYIRNVFAKKSEVTRKQVKELTDQILDTVIRGVPGINAAFVQTTSVAKLQPDGSLKSTKIYNIFTDGTNMEAILENPYIDPTTAQSDSIMEMYEIFGVQCARTKIIDELRFQVDAASYRHYTVYADEMVYNGNITSIDRYGSKKRDTSFMQRISDASPVGVIEEASLSRKSDPLRGVSPPIMVGKNPEIGDLYNTFKVDPEFVNDNLQNLEDVLDDL